MNHNMTRYAFASQPLDTVSGEVANWVSPSSTPPSACLSSSTAPRIFDITPATRRSHCCSPATASATREHQQQKLHPLRQPQQSYQQLAVLHKYYTHEQQQYPPQMRQKDHQHCTHSLQERARPLPPPAVPLPRQHTALTRLYDPSQQPARPAICCDPPRLPAVAAPCQSAVLWNSGHMLKESERDHQQQPQQRSTVLAVTLGQQMPLKRARELDPRELHPLHSRRTGDLGAPHRGSHLTSFTSSRCLQRYNSLDSDAAHSESSFIFAAATTATAATAIIATTSTALAQASSSLLQIKLQPPPPPTFLACRDIRTSLLPCRLVWGPGPLGYTRPPPTVPCAADGEEFILHAARALHLCPDTSAQLALHVWRRVSGVVRLVLSIRHPTTDGGDPRIAASTYRIFTTACLWLAAKVEERRRLVTEARVLAALAQTTADVLCSAELRLLAWVEWCPLLGYLPSSSPSP